MSAGMPATAPRDRLVLASWALFAAALGYRVFLILTGRAVPDGDEAIVGIMGLHLLQGHPSIYFLGQSYGAGAGIEAALAAAAFKVFGPTAAAFKFSALPVWAALALVVERTARAWFGPRAGAVALMLCSVMPTMAEWSTKHRGGHVLCLIPLVWLVALSARAWQGELKRPWLAPAAAFAAFCAAWFQPLAAPAAAGLLVLCGWRSLRRGQWGDALKVAGGGLLVLLAVAASMFGPGIWRPHKTDLARALPAVGQALTGTLFDFFTPYLDLLQPPLRPVLLVTAACWFAALWASAGFGVLLLLRSRREHPALPVILWGVAAVIFGAAMIEPRNLAPRHLLALYPLGVLLLTWAWQRLEPRRLAAAALGILMLAGVAGSLVPAWRPMYFDASYVEPLPAETVQRTVGFLRGRGVRYVFVADWVLVWSLIFESREEIIGRSFPPRDRYQPYIEEVNRAAQAGFNTVVIITWPDDPTHKGLVDRLRRIPGVRASHPSPKVLVLEEVPAAIALKVFPLDETPKFGKKE